MSSLKATIKKQFQLCLEFWNPIVKMLKNTRISHNSNLQVKVEHVEERSSLKLFLQKTNLKKKMYKIDEKQPNFKVDVQKNTL